MKDTFEKKQTSSEKDIEILGGGREKRCSRGGQETFNSSNTRLRMLSLERFSKWGQGAKEEGVFWDV